MQNSLVFDTIPLNVGQIVEESVAIVFVKRVSNLLIDALFTQIFVNQVLFCDLWVLLSVFGVIEIEAEMTL